MDRLPLGSPVGGGGGGGGLYPADHSDASPLTSKHTYARIDSLKLILAQAMYSVLARLAGRPIQTHGDKHSMHSDNGADGAQDLQYLP